VPPAPTTLSLTTPIPTSQLPPSTSSSNDSHETLIIALAAGVGGGVLLLSLIIVSVWLLCRRKRRQPALVLENPDIQSSPATGSAVVNELNAPFPDYPRLKSATSHEDGLNSGTETSEMGMSDAGWHLVERPRTPDALPPSISSRYNMFAGITPNSLTFPQPQPTTPPSSRFVRSNRVSQASVVDRPLSRLSDREVDRIAESLATKFQPPSRAGQSSTVGTARPRTSSVPGTTSDQNRRTNLTSWSRPSYDSPI